MRLLRVGDRLPEFSLPDLEGNPVVLTADGTLPLLIFVWASW